MVITRERAEVLAFNALGFIASDEELLPRFLALTGMDIASLRSSAGEIGTSIAVLDFLLYDDRLILAFAKAADIKPEEVMRTRLALAGPP